MAARKQIDEKQLEALYTSGLAMPAVAEKLGVSEVTVSRRLRKLKVPVRTQGEAQKLKYRLIRQHAVPLEDGSWGIPLSNGGYAIVDEIDADLSWEYTYRRQNYGYAHCVTSEGQHLLQRKIAERMGLCMDGEIDHINRNKLDNRRSNLRSATHAENLRNTVRRPGTSGYTGVYVFRMKCGTRYEGTFHFGGRVRTKRFKRLAAAIRWRNAMGRRLVGKFYAPTPMPRRIARPAVAVAA